MANKRGLFEVIGFHVLQLLTEFVTRWRDIADEIGKEK